MNIRQNAVSAGIYLDIGCTHRLRRRIWNLHGTSSTQQPLHLLTGRLEDDAARVQDGPFIGNSRLDLQAKQFLVDETAHKDSRTLPARGPDGRVRVSSSGHYQLVSDGIVDEQISKPRRWLVITRSSRTCSGTRAHGIMYESSVVEFWQGQFSA